jgi:hypothetical protein
MAIRVTINCVHCGKAWSTDMPTSASGYGSYGAQHNGAGGCNKTTRVYFKNGNVERTDTR